MPHGFPPLEEIDLRWKLSDATWTPWKPLEIPKGERSLETRIGGTTCEVRTTRSDGTNSVWSLSSNSVDSPEAATEDAAKHYKITGNKKFPYKIIQE